MKEKIYLICRLIYSAVQSIPFYLFRIFPIDYKKIAFTTIEGTTGYMCNPKYIAEKLLAENKDYKLVWLVNDVSKKFPERIIVKKNTLFNRAFQLTTSKVWIDNSRKQLEVRKRKNQVYIQTWHAQIGFKPTGYMRGQSFSKIAQFVSQHDSDMIDYMLSDCDMFDEIAPRGLLYNGVLLRTGSPRLDRLVKRNEDDKDAAKRKYEIDQDDYVVLWAPTFRGGSQSINRSITVEKASLDFEMISNAFSKKTGRKCQILLRLHPQLTARNICFDNDSVNIKDVSKVDDLYDVMMACDAVITDYSSIAFDAGAADIPVFLFCDDFNEYVAERGQLLWNIRNIAFPFADSNESLCKIIEDFSREKYLCEVRELMQSINMVEDGLASERIVRLINSICLSP